MFISVHGNICLTALQSLLAYAIDGALFPSVSVVAVWQSCVNDSEALQGKYKAPYGKSPAVAKHRSWSVYGHKHVAGGQQAHLR